MNQLFSSLLILALYSCTGSAQDPQTANKSGKTTAPAPSADPTCLLNYAGKYDQVLTLNEAAKLLGKETSNAEVKSSKVLKDTRFHEIKYLWKTDRIVEVSGLKIPDKDRIGVTGIYKNTMENFKRNYSQRTEQEVAELQQKLNTQLDKSFDSKSDNKKIEESKERMNEAGVSNKQGKAIAKNLGGGLTASLTAYSEVTGLGDAASWNSKDKNLYVLSNGVEFRVGINLGEDDVLNKAKAIEAAKLILQKCN